MGNRPPKMSKPQQQTTKSPVSKPSPLLSASNESPEKDQGQRQPRPAPKASAPVPPQPQPLLPPMPGQDDDEPDDLYRRKRACSRSRASKSGCPSSSSVERD